MVFHRVFDYVFSTWSHVAVLRALQDASQGLIGREIARLAGMNHRSCLNALTKLENLSIVLRQHGGRDHRFLLFAEKREERSPTINRQMVQSLRHPGREILN